MLPCAGGVQPLFIRTGLLEGLLGHKSSAHCSVSVEPVDGGAAHMQLAGDAEKEEAKLLERWVQKKGMIRCV